jgi:hypothetical protein
VLQLCGAAALEGVNLVVGPRFASMKKKHGIAPAAERGYLNVYICVYICVCVCVFISDYIEDLSNFHLYLKFKCVLSICRGRV